MIIGLSAQLMSPEKSKVKAGMKKCKDVEATPSKRLASKT